MLREHTSRPTREITSETSPRIRVGFDKIDVTGWIRSGTVSTPGSLRHALELFYCLIRGAALDATSARPAYSVLADPQLYGFVRRVIMRDTQDAPVLVIQEIGPATELTKGISFVTPFIENAPPPFAYYCPNC